MVSALTNRHAAGVGREEGAHRRTPRRLQSSFKTTAKLLTVFGIQCESRVTWYHSAVLRRKRFLPHPPQIWPCTCSQHLSWSQPSEGPHHCWQDYWAPAKIPDLCNHLHFVYLKISPPQFYLNVTFLSPAPKKKEMFFITLTRTPVVLPG